VFNYTFKKDPNKTPRVGVMAQDLEKIFPKAVFKGDDGFLRIRMEDMFYALVNAVKELDTKIENIISEVKTVVADVVEDPVDTTPPINLGGIFKDVSVEQLKALEVAAQREIASSKRKFSGFFGRR
jgi:hypothetical protein